MYICLLTLWRIIFIQTIRNNRSHLTKIKTKISNITSTIYQPLPTQSSVHHEDLIRAHHQLIITDDSLVHHVTWSVEGTPQSFALFTLSSLTIILSSSPHHYMTHGTLVSGNIQGGLVCQNHSVIIILSFRHHSICSWGNLTYPTMSFYCHSKVILRSF